MKRKLFTLLALSCIAFSSCSGDYVTINGKGSGSNVESFSISEVETTLKIGDSKTIYASASGVDKIQWVIGGDQYAISLVANEMNAVVTGQQAGVAYVRAIAGGKSEICKVTVSSTGSTSTVTVNSISLNPISKQISEGDSFTIDATVKSSGGTPAVSWSNSNNVAVSLLKQSSTRVLIKGLAEGTATITASSGGKSAECLVSVSKNDSGISISLNKTDLSLEEGKGFGLSAITTPSDAEVTWVSNNPTVASVTNKGYVSALQAGTAKISATISVSGLEMSAHCEVTVTSQQGNPDYDAQITEWSKPGHLYLHYLRKTDDDYDRWALWIWNSYPIDAEGTLWGANPYDKDTNPTGYDL